MNATSLTFIVPVRNDAARLRQCLTSINKNSQAGSIEVIVADNGSADDSLMAAQAAGARTVSVPHLTVAAVRNSAAATARGDLIAFVDADHVLQPGWAQAVFDLFADPTITAAGAPYLPPEHANWVQRAYNRLRPVVHGRVDTDWLASGNLVIHRTVFNAIGGFDESLESCEDVDLCFRLRKAGHRLVADARLRSVHQGDPRTLRAVFLGELWRGRDNLRVSLRGPKTIQALASLAVPVMHLSAGFLAALSWWLGPFALVAVTVGTSLTLFRCLRMTRKRTPSGLRDVAGNLVVAAVYDAARAAALVFRATHRTRRELAGEQVVG